MYQPVHANADATVNAFADALGATADAIGLASFGSQELLADFSSQDFRDMEQELQMQESVAPAACGLGISDLALPGNARASLNVPDTRDRVMPWGDLVLKLVHEGVHKIVPDEAGSPLEHIVSNLHFFWLKLELTHKDTGLLAMAEGNRLDVRATLLYENGNAVPPYGEDDKLLLGDPEVTVIKGKAKLKLKMGANSLSTKRGGRRFRIRIEPRDDALRAFPQLSATGVPLKSMTKLERGNAEQRAARAQAQPATPTQELTALSDELNTERLLQNIADQEQRMKELAAENERLLGEIAVLKPSVNEPPAATDAQAAVNEHFRQERGIAGEMVAREDAARAVRDMETGGALR